MIIAMALADGEELNGGWTQVSSLVVWGVAEAPEARWVSSHSYAEPVLGAHVMGTPPAGPFPLASDLSAARSIWLPDQEAPESCWEAPGVLLPLVDELVEDGEREEVLCATFDWVVTGNASMLPTGPVTVLTASIVSSPDADAACIRFIACLMSPWVDS